MSPDHLTSGRLLARNMLWNLMGIGLPFILAVFTIPIIIEGLGAERFGLLAIIWATIGYFSLFDLGLGRALTKFVAERLGSEAKEEIPHIIVTALGLMAGLGLLAGIVSALITPFLVEKVLHIQDYFLLEAQYSLWTMAVSLPFVILSAGLTGVLEAYQQFKAIGLVRAFLGVTNFLGPLIALQWTDNLEATTAVLSAARIFITVVYLVLCLRLAPAIRRGGLVRGGLLSGMLGFGGWMTISNLVGPIMINLDRVIIGAILSLSAVTYYTTPYEVVTRLFFLPTAVVGVLFPAFTTSLASRDGRIENLFRQANQAVLLIMAPLLTLIVLFSLEGLTLWISRDFALKSAGVLDWLALGVLVNSLARLPHAMIQGAGRPDIIAKVHLVEAPCYLVLLLSLLHIMGLVGAAAAWTLRAAVDAAVFYYFGAKLAPEIKTASIRSLEWMALVSVAMGLFSLFNTWWIKITAAIIVVCVSLFLGWRKVRVLPWIGHGRPEALNKAGSSGNADHGRNGSGF